MSNGQSLAKLRNDVEGPNFKDQVQDRNLYEQLPSGPECESQRSRQETHDHAQLNDANDEVFNFIDKKWDC
jgi:hypothetical protein